MPTPVVGMGLAARIRYRWRRVFLRYRQDVRKKPGARPRRATSGMSFKKWALLFTIFVGVGVGIVFTMLSREHDRASDEFITSFQNMYDQGDVGDTSDLGSKGSDPVARPYDLKARAFVDPKMRPKWGPEADKGREKRRLFMMVHEMGKEKGRPQLTLRELMALPSSYDPSQGVSDTTIILNQWKRTTLSEQLDAILNQTVRPAGGVWVCVFDSPRETEYRQVVEKYSERFKDFGGLFFIASSFNFKYYGRFQLALQARTRYVWVVDDDVMPGAKFLHQLSHIAGISEAGSAGGALGPTALGSVGWIMPGVKPSSGNFYSYRYRTDKGGLFLPDKRYGIPVPQLQEVDLLCSHWFLETDWVKLLFRERWETPETGEDYMLAYALRKYAGVRSYVVPMDLADSETWGNTDIDWGMQHQGGGATTLRSTVPMRDRLWHRLLKRGGEYFMSTRYALRPRPILLVVDGIADGEALRPLFLELQASCPVSSGGSSSADGGAVHGRGGAFKRSPQSALATAPQRPPRVALTGRGGSSISCSKAAVTLGVAKDGRGRASILCDTNMFAAAWDFVAGRHFPRDGTSRAGGSGGRDHVLMADLAAGLAGAVETLKPLAIVSVAGSGNAAGVGGAGGGGSALDEALALVAGKGGVALIRLPRKVDASGAALWLTRLTPKAFGAWHTARIDILVVYDPAKGRGEQGGNGEHTEAQLEALLDSLSEADYLGDKVGITVAVGSGRVPECVGDDIFTWLRGPKLVRASISPVSRPAASSGGGGDNSVAGGAPGQGGGEGGGGQRTGVVDRGLATLALRSWVPSDDDNFVVVIEADRVVSRLFYSWLKVAVLESNFGGVGGGSAQQGRGACLPGGGLGGNGTGGQPGGAWLFPPDHWRAAQTRCLGGGGGGGGRDACEREGYLRPPEQLLCPSLGGPGEALVARTGPDGEIVADAETLMEDDRTLLRVVERALFPQS